MSIGLFNSAIRPSPKTHVVYNIGINNQQIHTQKNSGVPTKVFIEQMSFYGCKIIWAGTYRVEIFLEQREVAFLSPSKICENLNFSTYIQIFANFAEW